MDFFNEPILHLRQASKLLGISDSVLRGRTDLKTFSFHDVVKLSKWKQTTFSLPEVCEQLDIRYATLQSWIREHKVKVSRGMRALTKKDIETIRQYKAKRKRGK